MVLIDSSVWIDFYNSDEDTPVLNAVVGLGEAATTDLIMTEVLQGFRLADRKRYRMALNDFEACHYVPMSGKRLAINSANNYRTLRSQGITPRRTIDVILVTLCIERRLKLLTHDTKDFLPIADSLKLQLL